MFLYKRAQIFAGDLWGAFGGVGLGAFDDVDRLTMCEGPRVRSGFRARTRAGAHSDRVWATFMVTDFIANLPVCKVG